MNVRWDPIRDKLEGIWRYRWFGIGAAAAIALVGWAIVFALPDRYQADAEVLVNQQTQLRPALQGLATEQNIGVQLDYVRESLLNGPELRKLAQQVGALPAASVDSGWEEQTLKGIRDRIQLTIQPADDQPQAGGPAGMTYGIAYQDGNRDRALRLVSALMDKLVNETLGNNRRGSENAQQFLGTQIQDYQRRLKASEDRLAAFKSQHLGLMPTEQGGYFVQLQHETESIEDTRTKLVTAESRRDALQRQLRGDSAISGAALPAIGADGKPMGVDTVSRIAETQARLDALLLKFTDKHPDVIAARQELASLKHQRQIELESLRRGDIAAAVASGASSNPVYQSILLQLNQANVDIADLRAQVAEHEDKAKELRGFVNTAPQIEAQYAQLSRDYDVNKAQYTALLSSFEKERMGEQAGSAGAVRFDMIQPPAVSYAPVAPRRAKILSEILVAALAAGAFLASWLDQMHPVVGSASSLAQLTGVAILGVVSSAFPTRDQVLLRSRRRQFAMALASLVVGFAIALLLSRSGVRLHIPGLTEVAS